jgi:hypothetical protein
VDDATRETAEPATVVVGPVTAVADRGRRGRWQRRAVDRHGDAVNRCSGLPSDRASGGGVVAVVHMTARGEALEQGLVASLGRLSTTSPSGWHWRSDC